MGRKDHERSSKEGRETGDAKESKGARGGRAFEASTPPFASNLNPGQDTRARTPYLGTYIASLPRCVAVGYATSKNYCAARGGQPTLALRHSATRSAHAAPAPNVATCIRSRSSGSRCTRARRGHASIFCESRAHAGERWAFRKRDHRTSPQHARHQHSRQATPCRIACAGFRWRSATLDASARVVAQHHVGGSV